MKLLPFLASTLPWLSGSAMAAVVNIDFNFREPDDPDPAPVTYAGLAAAPDSPSNTFWNSIRRTGSSSGFSSGASVNAPPLKDSSGTATGISVTVPNVTNGGYPATASLGQGKSAVDQETGTGDVWQKLMGDYLQLEGEAPAVPGDPIALVTAYGIIAGLTGGNFYDIYFYAQGVSRDQNSMFAITNGFGSSTLLGAAEQTGWSAGSSTDGAWQEGMEYVKLTAKADDSGKIYFSWSNVVGASDNGGANSRYAALNAMQIVSVVPEPSAALLGLLGMAGLLRRRRR